MESNQTHIITVDGLVEVALLQDTKTANRCLSLMLKFLFENWGIRLDSTQNIYFITTGDPHRLLKYLRALTNVGHLNIIGNCNNSDAVITIISALHGIKDKKLNIIKYIGDRT